MCIMLSVPARFLLATLCCLSLHTVGQANAAGPRPGPAEQQAACDKGNRDACTLLAYRYKRGDGVAKDAARAIALSERACDLADEAECAWLGYAYEKGKDGLPQNRARAAKFYQKGCELGDKEACCSVYMSCARGEGECQDPAKANALYLRAARANDPEKNYLDCWIMAEAEAILEVEASESKSAPAAPQATRKTPPAAQPSVAALQGDCERGSAKACSSLAEKYATGKGVPKDEATAVRLYEQACQGKDLLGCTYLGAMVVSGQGLPASVERASTIWRHACDAGEPNACTLLGSMYELRREPADPAAAAVYYQKGCNGGHGDGCTQLSKLYRSGLGVPQDAARADELWQRGCKRGSAACKQGQPPAGSSTAETSAKPASGACKVARVQLGVDTVASVERDILQRGGSPDSGGTGGDQSKFRLSAMSGDYRDVGTNVMAVSYDFDAAGPAGRLISVTIANHANSGPDYEKLLAERKAAAAAVAGPRQQKSATEFIASAPGCQLRMLPNAGTSFIHEVYQLPN